MPQPALGEEGKVEEDGGDAGTGDEEWFEPFCAYITDIGDALVGVHGGVVWFTDDIPMDEEAQEHAEPAQAGDDWEDLLKY